MQQHTIKNAISLQGIGLHSGKPAHIELRPAPINTGIVFRRVDLKPMVSIKAIPENVQETVLCTTLCEHKVKIATVEHLMAALAILCVDNIYIDVVGSEIPVMDGSAAPFVFAIKSTGIKEQKAIRRYISIKKTIKINHKDAYAEFSPAVNQQVLDVSICFKHPIIAKSSQTLTMEFNSDIFVRELSRARTFGFAEDLDQLKANNLALGASLENAVGLTHQSILNPEGLRYQDEFVRHKLLDALGDLYVLGPIEGIFKAHKSGHKLNNQLFRALLADKNAWIYVN